MKTQKKELPNEFTFVCDEHSREQLEKLGVDLNGYGVDMYSQTYLVKDNYVIGNNCISWFYKYKYAESMTPINLADYLDQEQPEQKWQEKTIGGFEYHIYEKFNGRIYGRVKTGFGNWLAIHWYDKGNYSFIEKHNWDLLPINHELTTLEKELEELRVKEKELLEKIEQLKTK